MNYPSITVVPVAELEPRFDQLKNEMLEAMREIVGAEYDGVEISGVEAAKMLGVSETTISTWKREDKIGVMRGGLKVITLGCVKRLRKSRGL